MRRNHLFQLLAFLPVYMLCVACQSDDTDHDDIDFTSYTLRSAEGDDDANSDVISTIYITYSEGSAAVTGDTNGYVSVSGADVTVDTGTSSDSLLIVLSGSTSDGSLLVNRTKKYGLQLNGVSIANADGPAINNQCGKSLYVYLASGTTNTLSDGTAYTEQTYDQKGTLFSEGQLFFMGMGKLSVTGNCKHAIACDDYIVVSEGDITATTSTGNAIKVNDGIWINGGTLDLSTTAAGGRGIKCDSVVVITGGDVTILTEGDCKTETVDGVEDITSAACIKCDSTFTMSDGTLTMTSTGDGGKCISSDKDIRFSGGTLYAVTTGTNYEAKPKAIKSETAIVVSGGSFWAQVDKSFACDNGYDDDTITDDDELAKLRITVEGSPQTATVTKKLVKIVY